MQIIKEGHQYEVANLESGSQTLSFIEKELVEDGSLQTVADGTTNEEVIAVLIDRLDFLCRKLPDAYTQEASTNLKSALGLLNARTEDRKARGVEGTNNA